MRRRVPEVLGPLLCLGLYHWSLVAHPPTPQEAAGDLSVAESQKLLDDSRTLLRGGRLAEALALTVRLQEVYPESHIYLYQRATLETRLGHPAAAAAAWEKYLEVSPTPLEACPAIGQAYAAADRLPDAIAAHERCLAFDPGNPDSLFFLGLAYERGGRYEEAKTLYAKGAAIAPDYPDLAIGLGRARLRTGRHFEAKKDYDRVIARWPANSDALLLGGLVLRALGDLEGARRALLKGVALSPDYVDLHAVLGGVSEQQGDLTLAAREYDEVLRLDPLNAGIAARRERIRVGGHR